MQFDEMNQFYTMQVLVSISDMSMETQIPLGVILSLFSALCYAMYLVFLRRKVDHEDKMDIPLFFGTSFPARLFI